jgi:hypothetical protein
MKVKTYLFNQKWNQKLSSELDSKNTLVVVFGSSDLSFVQQALDELIQTFPNSIIIGASTAGEIFQGEIYDETLSVMVMQFEHTILRQSKHFPITPQSSYESGLAVAKELYSADLKALFVLCDGLHANGSQLTKAIASIIPATVPVTGGLAADGDRFERTWVIVNSEVKSAFVAAVGFYGDSVHVAHASKGGWDRLGLERVVTKSKENILYELDHMPALQIYKRYLGEKAEGLPATGLLFPLELKAKHDSDESKVRTILAINEEQNSITFAGDIPEGSHVTLMKANYNRIIDGASQAAEQLQLQNYKDEALAVIAISCVGRRLVLKSRVEEELEAILEVLPPKAKQVGFYSYGEISPLASGKCDLHNQTMTLTVIWEEDEDA